MKGSAQGAARGRSQGHATPVLNIPAVKSGSSPSRGVAKRSNPIRVLVVDDHPITRIGIVKCLANDAHLVVVGEAADGKEALAKAKALSPDVVLMDLEMPKLDGLAATQALRSENPEIKVLILSMHKNSQYLVGMLKAGAYGYVSKEASPKELIRAIETVGAGEGFFGLGVTQVTLNQMVKNNEPTPGSKLSLREREVLAWIAEGLGSKEIASRLGLGVRTVETHRQNIMRKLNIHSVAGLTRFAIAEGLVSLPQKSRG
jgi:two-component system nitrate/nitrite response regulator NarL